MHPWGYVTLACLCFFEPSSPIKLARISRTVFAFGMHFSFPDLWRQRFMKRAVEYSKP